MGRNLVQLEIIRFKAGFFLLFCCDESDAFLSNYIKNMTDNKYGEGASDYIVKAFHYYSENNASENN